MFVTFYWPSPPSLDIIKLLTVLGASYRNFFAFFINPVSGFEKQSVLTNWMKILFSHQEVLGRGVTYGDWFKPFSIPPPPRWSWAPFAGKAGWVCCPMPPPISPSHGSPYQVSWAGPAGKTRWVCCRCYHPSSHLTGKADLICCPSHESVTHFRVIL